MALSYAFDPTQGETPQSVASKRQTAEALAARIFGRAPQNVGEGLNAIGQAFIARQLMGEAGDAQKAGLASGNEAFSQIGSAIGGGAQPAPVPAPGLAAAPAGNLPTVAAAPDTPGKIYSNDEPSPLDPPSGQDRQNMIATILGEAGNEPQLGKNAVASVIRTRAVDGGYGGDTPTGVVQAPNQFEPWNTQAGRTRMASAAANPQQAAAADAAIASAYGEGGRAPEDPTEGMTHFYSPGGQAALGRKPPGWAGGESVTIGGHVFNSPDDAPGRTQVAGDPSALPANAQPAQFVPGQPQAPASPAQPVGMASQIPTDQLLKIAQNPWLTDTQKSVVKGLLDQRLKAGSHVQETDANGNIWDVDNTTGQRTISLKAKDDPTSVQEYEYYKRTLPGDQKPMDYGTWSTAKARAGATTVNTNIGGGSDKQIFDTFAENTKEARAAATGLTALRTARQSLQGPGGAITGFGADERLGFQKLGAALGLANPEAIQNTETFRAAIAPQVAATLKSTVGTANISNSDREFAEKAAGGSIKLDAGSINRLLNIMEQAGSARLQLHQEQLDSVYPDAVANKRERALFGVKIPEAPAAAQPTTPPQTAAPAENATATNPKTGERLMFKNGKWVPFA